MKGIFELMKLDPIDAKFLDIIVGNKQLTDVEVNMMINDDYILDQTAEAIIKKNFMREL